MQSMLKNTEKLCSWQQIPISGLLCMCEGEIQSLYDACEACKIEYYEWEKERDKDLK